MKKHFMKFFALLLISLMGSGQFVWADDISLGVPGYGGTGCPGGTASVTLSPDRKTLSILFDSFITEAGGASGNSFDRKSCNIAIPVHVPQGISVSLFKVDYRGFIALPPGAFARFFVEYFFAGSAGPTFTKNFYGPETNDYLLSNLLQANAMIWSRCGEDVNLRVNTSLYTRTNRSREDALATVDSADVKAGIIYHVQWKSCR